ncbi:hypothetical protein [Muriicola soli]|uniref:Glycosyl hydrolase family 16 n=1 Tax=Muriicola soli TaxID=2507538 RepID=A0A411EAH4_9FLAO|nr:hypothetical protein [Muriicola soli]QBA64732.1 hypothetical protein EQY75_09455 [Muriicola soli]
MKNRNLTYQFSTLLLGFLFLALAGCEREFSNEVDFATFNNNSDIFIDGFSGGLEYLPFAGSKLNAFSVDTETRYKGESSMRFDVPNVGDPDGSFAGAIFPDMGGRDLSGYDALTFWAKATKAATINEIGFGQDFGENKYLVTKQNLRISTGWTKYIIPIPDPSKLMREKGLFWYAEGPEDGDGYTFWIDELRFENLGTIAQPQPAILGGQDVDQSAFVDIDIPLTGLTQTFNLASGINQTVSVAPSYFDFQSSDNDVARVSELGVVSPVGTGTAEITAILGGVRAEGSLSLDVAGGFVFAPTPPARDPANVISIFSDAYANVPVDFYNGFFAPFQTTLGGAIDVNGNNIIEYTELNFVATEFKNPTVDASAMTHFHVDIRIDEAIDSADFIAIELGDFGPNDAFGGGDDSSSRITLDSSDLVSGEWISLDIPLSDFTTLTSRSNLAQIFFISDATISVLLVDNMYFYTE